MHLRLGAYENVMQAPPDTSKQLVPLPVVRACVVKLRLSRRGPCAGSVAPTAVHATRTAVMPGLVLRVGGIHGALEGWHIQAPLRHRATAVLMALVRDVGTASRRGSRLRARTTCRDVAVVVGTVSRHVWQVRHSGMVATVRPVTPMPIPLHAIVIGAIVPVELRLQVVVVGAEVPRGLRVGGVRRLRAVYRRTRCGLVSHAVRWSPVHCHRMVTSYLFVGRG